MSMITGVHDYIKESDAFPYVYIGGFYEVPDNTFTEEGRMVTGTFHVWTDEPGDEKGLEIANRIVELLDYGSFNVAGYNLINSELVSLVPVRPEVRQDYDDSKREVMVTFLFTLERV
jgi:hypothetical protein